MTVVDSFHGTSTVGRPFLYWLTSLWSSSAFRLCLEEEMQSGNAMILSFGLRLSSAFTTDFSQLDMLSSFAFKLQVNANLSKDRRSTMAMWEVLRNEVIGTCHSALLMQLFWRLLSFGLIMLITQKWLNNVRKVMKILKFGAILQWLWLYMDIFQWFARIYYAFQQVAL